MEKPLVNKKYLLQKYPGKGGWTYAAIDSIKQETKSPFGWVKVKGRIDHFEIKNYRLMPMKGGGLFLPVKAEIRKKIGKKEGDSIQVVLYHDNEPLEIPEEMLLCFQDNPLEYQKFIQFPEGEQKAYINWIFSAKTEGTKITRMAKTLNQLAKGLKFNEK